MKLYSNVLLLLPVLKTNYPFKIWLNICIKTPIFSVNIEYYLKFKKAKYLYLFDCRPVGWDMAQKLIQKAPNLVKNVQCMKSWGKKFGKLKYCISYIKYFLIWLFSDFEMKIFKNVNILANNLNSEGTFYSPTII